MGGEGSIAGMIISLRNNANIRLGRRKYFIKDNPYLDTKEKTTRLKKHIKRTPQQIEAFRIREKARKKRELFIQIIAFIASATIAIGILYLFFGTALFS